MNMAQPQDFRQKEDEERVMLQTKVGELKEWDKQLDVKNFKFETKTVKGVEANAKKYNQQLTTIADGLNTATSAIQAVRNGHSNKYLQAQLTSKSCFSSVFGNQKY